MSKYTEAIKEAQFQIANAQVFLESKEYENEPAIQWSAKRKLRDFTIYLEALQLADRLEQAITDEQTADCIIVDVKCVNNKHDKEVWLNGYNQALVDIRGDAE